MVKENAGQTPSAENHGRDKRAPAGAGHTQPESWNGIWKPPTFQEQAREFQSLTELEEAMTAYEDQMDQNMADAADTAAHTAASGITGAAFTTLPIAELVTMHGSKGLEYDAVFLPCCMEGVVPHKKSKNQAALEEERRMFYVGMTRAKKELYLSYTKGTKETPGFASRFLAECGWKERNETVS
ncbi:MAG: 3'-5' exonuclease [Gallintestinimicrobium sp.]